MSTDGKNMSETADVTAVDVEFEDESLGCTGYEVKDADDDENDAGMLEFVLFRQNRDPALREKLIQDNLQIVIPIARRFKGNWEHLEDLIQVGYIGLIKAVDNFNPAVGTRFITYATHCINGEIRHYIRDKAESIKRPRWLNNLSREVARFVEEFMQKNERLPSINEISVSLNIGSDGVIEILKSRYILSVNEFDDNSPENSIQSRIRSRRMETFRLPVEDRIVLEQALYRLKIIEKRAVYLFFYMDLTQTQIAVDLGMSQKKVSRMLKKALEKLKKFIGGDRKDFQ